MPLRWALVGVVWALALKGIGGDVEQRGAADDRPVPDIAALASADPFEYKATILKVPPHESHGRAHLQLQRSTLHLRGQVIKKGGDKDGRNDQNFTVELLAIGAGEPTDVVYLRAALDGRVSCSNFSYPDLYAENHKAGASVREEELRVAAREQTWKYVGDDHLGDGNARAQIFETSLQRLRVMRVWFSREDDTILQVEVRRQARTTDLPSRKLREVSLNIEREGDKKADKSMQLTDGWVCDEIHDFVVGLGFLDGNPFRSLQLQETLYALRYLADFPKFVGTQVLATLGDLAVHVLPALPPIGAGQEHVSFHFNIAKWSAVEKMHWVAGHVAASIHSDPQYMRLKIGYAHSLQIHVYVEAVSVTVWIIAPAQKDQDRVQDCVIFPLKQSGGPVAYGRPKGMDVLDGIETSVWTYADPGSGYGGEFPDSATLYYNGESDEVLRAEFDYQTLSSERLELGIEGWTTTKIGHEMHHDLVQDHMQPEAECRSEMSQVAKSGPGVISRSTRPMDKSERGQPPEMLELMAISRMLSCVGLVSDEVSQFLQDIQWTDSSAGSAGDGKPGPPSSPKDKLDIFSSSLKFFSFDFETKVMDVMEGSQITDFKSRGTLRVDLQHKTLLMRATVAPDISTFLLIVISGEGMMRAESRTRVQDALTCWTATGNVPWDFRNPFAAGVEEVSIGDTEKETVYKLLLDHNERLYYRTHLEGKLLSMLFVMSDDSVARSAEIRVENWNASLTPVPVWTPGEESYARTEMHVGEDQACEHQDNVEDLMKWPLLRLVLGASKEQ